MLYILSLFWARVQSIMARLNEFIVTILGQSTVNNDKLNEFIVIILGQSTVTWSKVTDNQFIYFTIGHLSAAHPFRPPPTPSEQTKKRQIFRCLQPSLSNPPRCLQIPSPSPAPAMTTKSLLLILAFWLRWVITKQSVDY